MSVEYVLACGNVDVILCDRGVRTFCDHSRSMLDLSIIPPAKALCHLPILPAGTGHKCLKASDDFLVVGAYPPTGTYDECTSFEDRKKALSSIPRTARPRKDPVYGKDGPLLRAWRTVSRVRS